MAFGRAADYCCPHPNFQRRWIQKVSSIKRNFIRRKLPVSWWIWSRLIWYCSLSNTKICPVPQNIFWEVAVADKMHELRWVRRGGGVPSASAPTVLDLAPAQIPCLHSCIHFWLTPGHTQGLQLVTMSRVTTTAVPRPEFLQEGWHSGEYLKEGAVAPGKGTQPVQRNARATRFCEDFQAPCSPVWGSQ